MSRRAANPFYNSSFGTNEITDLIVGDLTVTGTASGDFGGISGPDPSVIYNAATWANTTGTELLDSGVKIRTKGQTAQAARSLYIGSNAIPSTGAGNSDTWINASSEAAYNSSFNTVIGPSACNALTGGQLNCVIGPSSFLNMTSGLGNIGIGYNMGNTFGTIESTALTTGSYNTLIGFRCGVNTGNSTNRISIGANSTCPEDNTIQLGDSIVTPVEQLFLGNRNLAYADTSGNIVIGGLRAKITNAPTYTNSIALGSDTITANGQVKLGTTSSTHVLFGNGSGTTLGTGAAPIGSIATVGPLKMQPLWDTDTLGTIDAGASNCGYASSSLFSMSIRINTTAYTASSIVMLTGTSQAGANPCLPLLDITNSVAGAMYIDISALANEADFMWFIINPLT